MNLASCDYLQNVDGLAKCTKLTSLELKGCYSLQNVDGIAKCTIEKAYLDSEIDFKKPISCHLFPIRIKEYRDFDAVNYEEIKICEPACKCGSKLEVPVYAFLKEPLIRKYGEDWYKELVQVAGSL